MSDYPLRRRAQPLSSIAETFRRKYAKPDTLALLAIVFLGGYVAHRGWFRPGVIASGDWHSVTELNMKMWWRWPQAWDTARGLGGVNAALTTVPIEVPLGLGWRLGWSYEVASRVFIFFPFTVLPFVSAYFLAKRFVQRVSMRALAAAIFGLNSYILMVGNAQMMVALAYAMTPFAVSAVFDLAKHLSQHDRVAAIRSAIIAGGWLGICTAIDSRIGYIGVAFCAALLITAAIAHRQWRLPLAGMSAMAGMVLAVNTWWILPLMLAGKGTALTSFIPSSPWISWADITHAAGLYHPFWTGGAPTVFITERPWIGVLGLPAVAFSVLLFERTRKDWRIASVAMLGLLSIFLVKGENAPLGGAYTWLFDYVPGMNLFRDMSKFSLATALAYAILIPVALETLLNRARANRATRHQASSANVIAYVALGAVLLPMLWFVKPTLTEELGGTLNPVEIPQDYVNTNALLDGDSSFGRVLWLPLVPSYSSRTATHPAVGPADISPHLPWTPSGANTFETLHLDETGEVLRSYGVRYLVTSLADEDYLGWPSATDDGKLAAQRSTRAVIDQANYLQFEKQFGKLTVWKITNPKPFAQVQSDSMVPTAVSMTGQQSSYRSGTFPVTPGQVQLDLAETSDPRWKTTFVGHTDDGQEVNLSAVPASVADQHARWLIEVPANVRTVTATLAFPMQKFATVGTVVSILSIALLIGLAAWRRTSRANALK
jgi:hypothetical protein